MALNLLIHADMNKILKSFMLCSDASLTGGAKLYCPFECLHELQRSFVLNAYNALKHDVSVLDVISELS